MSSLTIISTPSMIGSRKNLNLISSSSGKSTQNLSSKNLNLWPLGSILSHPPSTCAKLSMSHKKISWEKWQKINKMIPKMSSKSETSNLSLNADPSTKKTGSPIKKVTNSTSRFNAYTKKRKCWTDSPCNITQSYILCSGSAVSKYAPLCSTTKIYRTRKSSFSSIWV